MSKSGENVILIVLTIFVSTADPDDRPSVDAYKLSTVRMKLEEKRRQIEQDKRKIEVNLNRHQQKVGKAAFLQAINKVINTNPLHFGAIALFL